MLRWCLLLLAALLIAPVAAAQGEGGVSQVRAASLSPLPTANAGRVTLFTASGRLVALADGRALGLAGGAWRRLDAEALTGVEVVGTASDGARAALLLGRSGMTQRAA